METSCSFELWDICGTSYAPFPLDEPKFKGRAGVTLLSSLGSHDRCQRVPDTLGRTPGRFA